MPACVECARTVTARTAPCAACPVVATTPWPRVVCSAMLAWQDPDAHQWADGTTRAMPQAYVRALRDRGFLVMMPRTGPGIGGCRIKLSDEGRDAWAAVHAAWEGRR